MKIRIGDTTDQSKLKFTASAAHSSTMEIYIGQGRDMSEREIAIVERDAPQLEKELQRLKETVEKVTTTLPAPVREQLKDEADRFGDTAMEVVEKRRWAPLSAHKLVAAATSIGSAAKPILESVEKVVDLFQKLHG